jgi:poly-gamma-glutamate synthesis protein (capsule biosynthesis protein)
MTLVAGLIGLLIAWMTPSLADAPGVFVRNAAPERQEATVLFGGDMMFDRAIRVAMRENGDDFVFSCLPKSLINVDLFVANLEGPITSQTSVSEGSTPGGDNNFTFTFPTSTATLLKRHNITLVNLGNNHIMNFGREGLAETREWLERVGVAYFGDPEAIEEDRVARLTMNGIPFSFVNWSDWTSDKTDHTVAQVRKEAETGRVVVVYTHWGDEYVPPTPPMRQLAHSFVDAGAAIVIGSHPHIVQEHEVYNGKDIYYSLGNFVFDQYFSEEVREGLLVRVTFDKTGVVAVEEIPTYLERDRRTCLKEVEN